MPPLTLQQILARSMRMSRKRVPQQISKLFDQPSQRVEKGINVSQTLFGKSSLSARFDQMVKKETDQMSHCMSIHSSKGLVKNNVDLLNILRSNAKLGTWEDAVAAFVHNTGCQFTSLGTVNKIHNNYKVNLNNVNDDNDNDNDDDDNSNNATKQNATSGVIQPTVQHVNVLMDMCVKAGQWNLVQDLVSKYAQQFPQILVRVANALTKRAYYANNSAYSNLQKEYESYSDNDMWHKQSAMLPLWFIMQKCNVPCYCILVDVYNVCLRLCESEHNWLGALRIVRSMGSNPLQKINLCPQQQDAKQQVMQQPLLSRQCQKHDKQNTNDEKEADQNDHQHHHHHNNINDSNHRQNNYYGNDVENQDELAHLPVPNVVTYAILIATLEQAGRNDLARRVLAILPPLEREEITASYAALIYVWASQAANAHNHHRRSKKF